MYSVGDYLWMLSDQARVSAYAAAIRSIVKPGDRLLEVGSGLGFFAVLAARAGAFVDAIDTNPAIHLGPKIAAANGCSDRIRFHAIDVCDLRLDGRVDVLLADLRGPLAFSGRGLEVLMRARDKWLRPGGTVIAAKDTLFAAPARAPSAFRTELEPPLQRMDVVLEPAARVVRDTPLRCRATDDDLLAGGQPWLHLDFASIAGTAYFGEAAWTLNNPVTVDGILLWFESDVGGGATLSSAPSSSSFVYRQIYLPFSRPAGIDAGTTLRVGLGVRLVRDDYIWSWRASTRSGGSECVIADQNSLAELVIDAAAFRK